MRINCGYAGWVKDLSEEFWHKRFAWWPVRIGPLPGDCVWLTFYETRVTINGGWGHYERLWHCRALGSGALTRDEICERIVAADDGTDKRIGKLREAANKGLAPGLIALLARALASAGSVAND